MIGDEGTSDEGQAMESLGTGARGGLLPSLQEGRELAGETGAEALIINFLLILLWIEMKL